MHHDWRVNDDGTCKGARSVPLHHLNKPAHRGHLAHASIIITCQLRQGCCQLPPTHPPTSEVPDGPPTYLQHGQPAYNLCLATDAVTDKCKHLCKECAEWKKNQAGAVTGRMLGSSCWRLGSSCCCSHFVHTTCHACQKEIPLRRTTTRGPPSRLSAAFSHMYCLGSVVFSVQDLAGSLSSPGKY
jgi:hypothetical protein